MKEKEKEAYLAYHNCNQILLPSSSIVLILKSAPAWRDNGGEVNNSVVGKLITGAKKVKKAENKQM